MGKRRIAPWTVLCLGLATAPLAAQTSAEPATYVEAQPAAEDEVLPQLLGELSQAAQRSARASNPGDIELCSLQQADVLERLTAHATAEEREGWVRQLADCLQMAAVNSPPGDGNAFGRLSNLERQVGAALPGSDLAAYVSYRDIQAHYLANLNRPDADLHATQMDWRNRLVEFVRRYPRSKDTANAWMELATVCEATGLKADAAQSYEHIAQDFPADPLAGKAESALHWLQLQGRTLDLALPLLNVENERCDMPFDIDELRGKLVVVYCWSAASPRTAQDLRALRQLIAGHDGVQLVAVNMDLGPQRARAFLRGNPVAAIHVFQRGGLAGPLATRCGITTLPSLMLVGPDGRVLVRTTDLGAFQEEARQQVVHK